MKFDPINEKEIFNLRHASLRNVIEKIFGIFKSQFTIFKLAPSFYLRHTQSLCWHVQHFIIFFAKHVIMINFPSNLLTSFHLHLQCYQITKAVIMNPLLKNKSRNENMLIYGGMFIYVEKCYLRKHIRITLLLFWGQ
jgi:hypothetical protein